MSILTRPRFVVKPAIVTRVLFDSAKIAVPTAFSVSPCPSILADAAIASGKASRLPLSNGLGLTGAEATRLNAARNAAWHRTESVATGDDMEVARKVGAAVRTAQAVELRAILADRPRLVPIVVEPAVSTRPFEPTMADRIWICQTVEVEERAAHFAYLDARAEQHAWYEIQAGLDVPCGTFGHYA